MPAINTVSILGVGLIGGSFALALRSVGYTGRIVGVSSPSTLSRATELGVIDEGRPLEEALPISDFVYMAQPVWRIVAQLGKVRDHAPFHALVTDAGSTKQAIVDRARKLFSRGPAFVGGHPMAGKEGRGVEIAECELFRGATYALVPTGETLPDTPAFLEFRGWLDAMGCRVRMMGAAEHDRVVSWTSQMPQLVSTALAAAIGSALADTSDIEVAGDGLRDMTRLAASSYEVWADILQSNLGPIDQALGTVIGELESLREALQSNGAGAHFERGRALREALEQIYLGDLEAATAPLLGADSARLGPGRP